MTSSYICVTQTPVKYRILSSCRKSPHASVPWIPHTQAITVLIFFYHRLVLPVLELHVNAIIQCILFFHGFIHPVYVLRFIHDVACVSSWFLSLLVVPFKYSVVFHYINILQFVYPSPIDNHLYIVFKWDWAESLFYCLPARPVLEQIEKKMCKRNYFYWF